MRCLVAVAVLSVALQPCLACALEQDGPAVRSAGPCHESTHQVVTACLEVLDAGMVVAPTVPVGIPAPLSPVPELVLGPLRSIGDATVEPWAPTQGPPLWLRHVSLLV